MTALPKTYTGRRIRAGHKQYLVIAVNGKPLLPAASLKVFNHSPTGFEWGYSGSGPAQLALAILLDYLGDVNRAIRNYQDFKCAYVARWGAAWGITGDEIEDFLEKNERRDNAQIS